MSDLHSKHKKISNSVAKLGSVKELSSRENSQKEKQKRYVDWKKLKNTLKPSTP